MFVDILPDTLCMDPAAIKGAVTSRTKAVMPVDLFGLPADADAIKSVADVRGVAVVEDACQAWGATYKGRRAGSLGDMAVFSFFPTKNLGGYGDGGLVTAHSKVLVDRARELRFHGSKDKKTFTDIGFNSRLDEVQAAILRLELEVIDEWNARRVQVAEWYDLYLPDEIVRPAVPDELTHVYHLYVIRHATARRHRRRLQGAPGRLRRLLHDARCSCSPRSPTRVTSWATSPTPTRPPPRTSPSPCTPTSPRSRSRKWRTASPRASA